MQTKHSSAASRSRKPSKTRSRDAHKIKLDRLPKGQRTTLPETRHKAFACLASPGTFNRTNDGLNLLGTWFHQVAKAKGWWKGKAGIPEKKLLLMHSEISEGVEELRSGRSQTEVYFKKDKNGQMKPEGVPIEMADLIIRALDYCSKYGIDIDRAVRVKMEFNDNRPYRHGGKAF